MLYGDFTAVALSKGNGALHGALAFWRDRAAGLPDGRYELEDGVFAQIKEVTAKAKDGPRYEYHVRYADIQCVLDGEEMIYVRPTEGLAVADDKLEEKDVAYFSEPADGDGELSLVMRPGFFVLLYPEDAHKPECAVGAADLGKAHRKIIFKIPMNLL